MIHFSCPNCDKHLQHSRPSVKVACPKCGQRILVPSPQGTSNPMILGKLRPDSTAPSASRGAVLQVPTTSATDGRHEIVVADDERASRRLHGKAVDSTRYDRKRHLSPEDYRVPGEKLWLVVSLGALVGLIALLIGWTAGLILIYFAISALIICIRQASFLGHAVKVSENQFPEVHRCAALAADRLSMRMPQVFIQQDPTINAMALGFLGRTSVVLNSALVEALDEDQLTAIIGHEFSHIKCGHTTWMVFAAPKETVTDPILSGVLSLLFFAWLRKCELTCDRGGILACRNPKAAVQALAKLAIGKVLYVKMDIDALFEQRKDIEQDELARQCEAFDTHPHIVSRLHAIVDFSESEAYSRLTA